jgi:hypothetical protein
VHAIPHNIDGTNCPGLRVLKMPHPLCSPPPRLPPRPLAGAPGRSAAEVRVGARVFTMPHPLVDKKKSLLVDKKNPS